MRHTPAAAILFALLVGCATPNAVTPITPENVDATTKVAGNPSPNPLCGDGASGRRSAPCAPNPFGEPTAEPARADNGGAWIGAAGLSDLAVRGTSDTLLGVWVDVPSTKKQAAASSAVALVVDTSGSMGGPKIEHARAAARSLVGKLIDGDIVSLQSFADTAEERLPLTVLRSHTRPQVDQAIGMLIPTGGTNLFDGLRSGERSVFDAPSTHVKRVVLISDGQANVGPTSIEVLGALAAKGADNGIQITSVGVGLDYDENTLNALATRSNGRLYHIAETRDLATILEREMGLLKSTAATGAFIEIVPAPGVRLLGVDGVASSWSQGSLKVPLGSMFAGEHREMLVRVRVTAQADGAHPLASVRLHFNDSADGNLERVQEVVARYETTGDASAVASRQNDKTRAIDVALVGAAVQLAEAEKRILASAGAAKDESDKKRLTVLAAKTKQAHQVMQAAAAAPPAAKPAAARAAALEANDAKMDMESK